MLKGRGWFGGGGLWRKNPHSLDHLRYLYNVLSKNQVVQESNRGLLVETLRSIAEILIWGDQNDSSVFDFFLEKNMLSFFLPIMKQKCGSYVCVQLLQTLNILFENIRNETSLYYLLSNNHVNSIIVHKFDFSDEEVMAYYISFLKTLSLKLNTHTIHFFYNEHTNDFPLYTEAIKFFNHPESMVRIAVRTLTLNVYRVNDQSMLQFIRDRTAAPYFSNLVWFIGNHILELENCVRSDVDHNSRGRLEDIVAEHLDHLHYINDILKLNISTLNAVLADHLLNRLLVPLLVYSLNPRQEKDDRPRISNVVALFLLAQVFLIISHAPLVRALAKIIFHGDNTIFTEDTQIFQGHRFVRRVFIAPEEPLEKSLQAPPSSGLGSSSSTSLSPAEELTGEGGAGGGGDQTSGEDAIGISELAATHVNITDEEKELMRAATTTTTTTTTATTTTTSTTTTDAATTTNINTTATTTTTTATATAATTALSVCSSIEKATLQGGGGGGGGATADEGDSGGGGGGGGGGRVGGLTDLSLVSRPFLLSTVNALCCSGDDYSSLFALCLLYALGHNQGINQELLDIVVGGGGHPNSKTAYDSFLVDKMLEIITLSSQYNSRVRVATLEMAILVLKQLVGVGGSGGGRRSAYLRDNHLASLEGAREEATLMLRNFYKSEEIFLDMFEDEWLELHRRPLNVEYLLQDASVLLPPAGTPLTGIDFNKRLPCGEVERARRSMRVFFLVREVCLAVRDENDPHLPLTNPAACVQVADVLDLNNSDLIKCVVIPRDGQRTIRFLVIDVIQLILVEPDLRRLGWGVAKFVGFLQDLEVSGDKDDSRVLHITIHRPSASSGRPSPPLLAAKFIFDDHIRCMAAKQRLIKGRLKARQRKLHQIARLLELPSHLQPCPSPPAHALHTMRQEAHRQRLGRVGDARSRSVNSHRPLFNLSVVPGFALKRDGEDGHDGGGTRSTINLSPGGRNSRHLSRQPHPSSSSSSSSSSTSAPHHPERGGRSTSRPRPRSEEIPLEDMITSGNLQHNSLSMPKVNIEDTTTTTTTTTPTTTTSPLDHPNPSMTPPTNTPETPPEEHQEESKRGDTAPNTPSLPSLGKQTETSFSAPMQSSAYDVFEPRTNGQVEGAGGDTPPSNQPRGSLGSADFSPIRKGRIKGSVETV